jgi:aldose 1-epimerase
MSVEISSFGKSPDGQDITLYTLSNKNGMKASVTNLGAVLASLKVPDAEGNIEDVVLGFDSGDKYCDNPSVFGAIVGPSANRIAGASFVIEGKEYKLDANDGVNNLHSHAKLGYHKRFWKADAEDNSVTFTLIDNATLGFPGNKSVSVVYTLGEDNSLAIHYHMSSDKATLFNPTNHTYFNLDGAGNGNIEDHEVMIASSAYTPVVAGAIPTGEIADVTGTPMDLRVMKRVGDDIDSDFEQLRLTGGYDHNWVIDGWNGKLRHIATVKASKSGRVLQAYTTLPGVQFYTGNFIDTQYGRGGALYEKRYGLCLETQYYPDSIHHENFPSCIFGGEGKDYDSVTVYKFEKNVESFKD